MKKYTQETIDNLAILVRRLCNTIKEPSTVKDQARDYLQRHSLQGTPCRTELADLALQQKPAVLEGERVAALEHVDFVLALYKNCATTYGIPEIYKTIKAALQENADVWHAHCKDEGSAERNTE